MEDKNYNGLEIGPIRPPSESQSLLLRVTRNCPWNRCGFCGLYKNQTFSIREKDHVLRDIDLIGDGIQALRNGYPLQIGYYGPLVERWYRHGMTSVFLQDANTLVYPATDLAQIILYLRNKFPEIRRITSYARSHTLAIKSLKDLKMLRDAGLDRIHVGMESGSDQVLAMVQKGCTKAMHVEAGQKAKETGFELSEYIMPGLGGAALTEQHALETADALNQINPDFIRIRTLVVPNHVPLAEQMREGQFIPLNDVQTARELLQLITNLDGIDSMIYSDHILNLLPAVEGKFPKDKKKMCSEIKWFLDLSEDNQRLYRVGRRMGLMNSREDIENGRLIRQVEAWISENHITPENLDDVMARMMRRFI